MAMFGWCMETKHSECRREFQKYYFEVRKGKTHIVYLDEYVTCECSKRGCKCFVPAKDRGKPKTRRRKK